MSQTCNASEGNLGEIISRPEGFDFQPDFSIFRGNGKPLGAKTNFEPKTKSNIGASTTYYVSISIGDNSNDGLSQSTPFKSIWRALKQQGSKNIIIGQGRYDYDDAWYGVRHNDDLSLISNGNGAILTNHIPVEFSKISGKIYKATKSYRIAWGNVVDLSQPLEKRVLRKAQTPQIGLGEYYADRDDLYVSTHDGRAPDGQLLTMLAQRGKQPQASGNVYIENVEFWGGYDGIFVRIPEEDLMVLNKVTSRYSHGGVGFRFQIAGQGITYKCAAYNNGGDDFNWHSYEEKSGHCVEIDSISRYAGNNTQLDSVNASTSHEAIKLIRINGDYRYAQNRVVSDGDETQNWNIACIAQGSRHNKPESMWWSQNWNFGGNISSWIDTCVGSNQNDTSSRGWSAESNAQVYFRNTDYTSGDTKFAIKPLDY